MSIFIEFLEHCSEMLCMFNLKTSWDETLLFPEKMHFDSKICRDNGHFLENVHLCAGVLIGSIFWLCWEQRPVYLGGLDCPPPPFEDSWVQVVPPEQVQLFPPHIPFWWILWLWICVCSSSFCIVACQALGYKLGNLIRWSSLRQGRQRMERHESQPPMKKHKALIVS